LPGNQRETGEKQCLLNGNNQSGKEMDVSKKMLKTANKEE